MPWKLARDHNITGWWSGTMEFYDFPHAGNGIIIPTDEVRFFRGVGQPPTRYLIIIYHH